MHTTIAIDRAADYKRALETIIKAQQECGHDAREAIRRSRSGWVRLGVRFTKGMPVDVQVTKDLHDNP
jgi:hypothetical protein